jgi:hypothetical protein
MLGRQQEKAIAKSTLKSLILEFINFINYEDNNINGGLVDRSIAQRIIDSAPIDQDFLSFDDYYYNLMEIIKDTNICESFIDFIFSKYIDIDTFEDYLYMITIKKQNDELKQKENELNTIKNLNSDIILKYQEKQSNEKGEE